LKLTVEAYLNMHSPVIVDSQRKMACKFKLGADLMQALNTISPNVEMGIFSCLCKQPLCCRFCNRFQADVLWTKAIAQNVFTSV